MDDVPEEVDSPPEVFPCDICGRSFVEQTLQRHTKICVKSVTKRRKVFDSSKQRAQGTEITNIPKADPRKIEKAKKATASWRSKHEDLVSTLKAARDVTRAIKTGAPLPPPPSQTKVNPDYVQCPFCQRNFSDGAAERHIPWCKTQSKRISPGKKPVNKERVATRTQYKPPLPGAKKRQIAPPRAGPAMRTGRTGSGSSTTQLDHVESKYSNMNINDNATQGRGNKKTGGRSLQNGPKARSASLERRSERPVDNYRSSSGDTLHGKSRYTEDDYDDDYDNGGYGEPDRYGRRRAGPNHVLPHQRLKAAKEQSSPTSRTPTPPSRNTSGNSHHRKLSLENINSRRASKFCHECGTQYPVPQAKFCCECGIRRTYHD